MKILYIDPQSSANLAQYDYHLLQEIRQQIIYCCNINYDANQLNNVDYRFVFKYNIYKNNIWRGISYIISLIKIFSVIRKERPNVIHIQWIKLWQFDFLLLTIIKLLYNAKVVYTAHNVLPHDSGNSYKSRMKRYYQKVDVIITHTLVSKKELIELFSLNESKIQVIPHGLFLFDGNREELNLAKQRISAKLNLENKLVFSVLGIQNKYKGISLVMDLWKDLSKYNFFSRIELLIIGKKGNIDLSEMLGYDNVFVCDNYISNIDFQAYLEITDVLLLPYIKISQSGVLLSAIGSKIPFLVTNVGGLSEPLSVADVGWCIGEATIDNLKKKMMEIITNPNEVEIKKNNTLGWKLVQDYYNWATISSKTEKLYLTLKEL